VNIDMIDRVCIVGVMRSLADVCSSDGGCDIARAYLTQSLPLPRNDPIMAPHVEARPRRTQWQFVYDPNDLQVVVKHELRSDTPTR
jgi:hypothetical protein